MPVQFDVYFHDDGRRAMTTAWRLLKWKTPESFRIAGLAATRFTAENA